MTDQNVGLACCQLWPDVAGFLNHHSISQWPETRLGGCGGPLQNVTKESIFLHVLLPGANGRERSLLVSKPCRPLRCRQSPDTQALGTQLPNCGLEWGLGREQVVYKDPCFSTLIHLVETCQTASSRAVHLFSRMSERKYIAYRLPPSLGVFVVIGSHSGPHGCGFPFARYAPLLNSPLCK